MVCSSDPLLGRKSYYSCWVVAISRFSHNIALLLLHLRALVSHVILTLNLDKYEELPVILISHLSADIGKA